MRALALNAGSSTLKAAVYEVGRGAELALPEQPVWRGDVEWDPADGARVAAELIADAPREVAVVGHRIVHGGARFRAPAQLTDEVRSAVRALSTWAPLHNPAALAGVEAAERFGGAQVGVFDTTFHATLPPAAHVYAGPREWLERGLRRFGFHGISHHYAAHRAARLLGRPLAELRLITCHLGSGCSLAAVAGGRSVDTTMGFTPLDGLVMGSRPGSLDPGLLLYLLRQPGASVERLETQLNHQSGLRGLSRGSGDLRDVLAARRAGDERAQLAFDVYVHRLRAHLGAMAAALGGVDAVVFTAGAGERSAEVRSAALEPFRFLGVEVDEQRNGAVVPGTDDDVATPASPVRALVVHAREEWAIAHAAAAFMSA
jgi:acetate kinase